MRFRRVSLLLIVLLSSFSYAATPQVDGMSPSSGPVGTQVQINGSGFGTTQGSSTVTFNNTNATVVSWSDTQVLAAVPAAAITGPVKVTVAGVASNTNVYFSVPAPVVSSISPTSGVVGTQVTVNGSGFQATKGSSSIIIGGLYGTTSNWSDTQIVATVPAGATTGPVWVSVNGISSNQDVLLSLPNPVISGLVPSSGPVGTQAQINGRGFGATQGTSTVTFNNTNPTVVSWSDTQVVATIPATVTTGPVKVTVGSVGSNANLYFTVPTPRITNVSPTSGVVGTQVTVNGSGFQATKGSSYVSFNGYTGAVTSWSDTQIVATVPAAASTGPVRVYVNGLMSNLDVILTMPSPVITGLSPSSGGAGAQVQINGSGFGATQGISTLTFNNTNAAIVSWSDAQIVATVPAATSTGFVKVTVGGVPSNANLYFTVPAPQVSSISPTSGVVGTQVTLNGSGFQAAQGSSYVTFNGYNAAIVSWTNTQLVATVPANARTGPVVVTVSNVISNLDVVFTMPTPVISGLSPNNGVIGTQVQINGSGFGATQGSGTVTFNNVSASVSSWSGTQIVATVPASATTGPVVVTAGGVSGNSVSFTVGSLVVSTVSPKVGPVGTQITVNGLGFGSTQGTSTISVNGSTASVSAWTDTQIVATVPSGATTGPVRVTKGGIPSNADVVFTVGGVTISSISPTAGGVGTQVQVNGSGFGATRGSSYVTFNGYVATIVSWSDTQIVAAVPAGATTGPVKAVVNSVSSNQDVLFTTPNPAVAGLVPTSGPVGTQVQINGSGFGATQGASTMMFNYVAATVVSWSDSQIVATVPATATTGPAKINVGGIDSNINFRFTVPAPQVNSVSPTSGTAGTQVTILGSGFQATKGSSYVAFNGNPASTTSWSDTQIVATVPAAATSGPVMVRVNSVYSNQDVAFTMPKPVVAGLSPTSGPVGTQVQINGSGFGATQGSSTITFNYVATAVVSWSDTQIVATVPSTAATGPTKVSVGGIDSNTNINFAVPAPQVSSVSPTSGAVGTQVTISGSGFQATKGTNAYVKFNGNFATVVSWSDAQIVATVPAGTTTGPVMVTASNNVSSNLDVVFTMPSPIVASLVPTSGPVGTQVQINGSGFGATQGSSSITFNNTNVTATSWTDTQIVATVSSTTTTGAVKVTVGGVASNATVNFTVPAARIDSISPAIAGVGNTVTLSGLGFQANKGSSYVAFTGYSGSTVNSWSDTQISTVVPSAATTGPVRVYVNGIPSNLVNYTVPNLRITTLSPTSGPVGTQVSVTGVGFGATQGSSTLTFNGSLPSSIASWSDTQILASVANTTTTGPAIVVVNNTASNSTVLFTVPPPAVTSVTPQGGPTGTQITVAGSGFQGTQQSSTITINGIPATVPNWSDTQIVANVAATSTTGPVVVTVNSVASNSGVSFTVPNQVITSLSPPSAGVGGTVILNGTGFGAAASPGGGQVTFNSLAASVVSWSDTSVAVTVPTNATSGPVILTRFGIPSNTVQFSLTGQLSVTDLSPAAGPIGTSVTITGNGFGATQSNSTLAFNGTPAAITSWSDSTIVAVVQAGTTSGQVSAVVAGVTAQGPAFSINATFQLTDSLGNQSSYTTSVAGGKWYVTDAQGSGCSSCTERGTVHNVYDSRGNIISRTDELGHTTSYTYDTANNLTSESIPLDGGATATTSSTYNSFGELLTVTDPLGHTTTNTYDTKGNLLSVTSPSPDGNTAASVTQFAYDTKGELTQITDPLNRLTTLAYTTAGLINTITDTQQHVTSYEYDAHGNRTAVVDALQHRTTFAYDTGDRLVTITYPGGATTGFGYDYRGRRTSVTDQNGKTTTYAYDDADRLVSVTDAAQNATQYAYDTENNLLSITDANGHVTSFTYDAFGRVIQTAFPSSHAEAYAYDALGNLTSKTDRKGQAISYVYDALNRLTHKGYPDSTGVDYVYDLVGKIQQVSDPTGTYGFAYDNMGRLIGTTTHYSFLTTTFSNTYTYDAESNRKTLTAPDGSTNTYNYDTLNRLSGLTSSLTGQFGFGYDALSRRTQLTRPNGITTNYSYDSLSRLLSVLHQSGGVTVDGASYAYDPAGNRTSKTNQMNNVTEGYTYDPLYQLTQVVQGATTTESYSYDDVGNRLSSLGVSPYAYNSSNQMTSTSAAGYAYDNNGSTVGKTDTGGTTQYTWDFENRLAQVLLPGTAGTVTFKYDPFGRRIQKSSTSGTVNYLYDGASLIEELDSSGIPLAKYTQGIRINEPLAQLRSSNTNYYESDGLGSITSLSNGSGALANTYTYNSYGNLTASSGTIVTPFQYTGEEFDQQTGIYYYRARYMDATTGRFITEDSLGFDAGTNFYIYVNNSPTNLIDPLGMAPDWFSPWWWANKLPWPIFPGHEPHKPGDSTLVFDRAAGILTVYGPDGHVVFTCIAHNYAVGNGPWPNGTYPFSWHNNHPADTNGPYGSYGIDIFEVPGRTGMGVHSGRANRGGPNAVTNGCVRTTDDCMRDITNYQVTHPIESITTQ